MLAALALAAVAAMSASPASVGDGQPAGDVVIKGLDGRALSLSVADLSKLPQVKVALSHDGRTTVYAGPLLSSLLRDREAPLGVRFHGAAADMLVEVRARDGYRVVLSLGEVDPGLHRDAAVILADSADGRPLDAHDGPIRLVVDGDLKPARAARQVQEIDLVKAP